jgi:hypothetical protein
VLELARDVWFWKRFWEDVSDLLVAGDVIDLERSFLEMIP